MPLNYGRNVSTLTTHNSAVPTRNFPNEIAETIPPHNQQRVPPPLPTAFPVGTSFPSPPVYTSPLYRPDIDLSLPPNIVPERNQVRFFSKFFMQFTLYILCMILLSKNGRMVQVFCDNHTSQVVAYPPMAHALPPQSLRSPSHSEPKRASTSVNLILQPTQEQVVPFVSFTSASMDTHTGRHSQLKITISPQGKLLIQTLKECLYSTF